MRKSKEDLRKQMAALRPTLARGNPQAVLLQSALWAASQSIGLYAAIRDEAATDLLIASQDNKQLFLPRITDKANCQMEFLPCRGPLREGPFRIPEPQTGTAPAGLDLLVVPGLAFDRAGSRLGFGGGFYDRFLRDHPHYAKIIVGLCYTGQILSGLPRDDWDLTVQALCTEDGIVWL